MDVKRRLLKEIMLNYSNDPFQFTQSQFSACNSTQKVFSVLLNDALNECFDCNHAKNHQEKAMRLMFQADYSPLWFISWNFYCNLLVLMRMLVPRFLSWQSALMNNTCAGCHFPPKHIMFRLHSCDAASI